MHWPPAPALARPVNLPAAPDDAGSRLERLCSWPAAHVELVDLALAALLWLLTAAAHPVSYAGLPMGALEMLALFGVATLQAVPLAWRRTRAGWWSRWSSSASLSRLVLLLFPWRSL